MAESPLHGVSPQHHEAPSGQYRLHGAAVDRPTRGFVWCFSLYLHTHHRDEFEFFLIGGEDTFVLVDNLHRLLGSDSIRQAAGPLGDQPLYLGRRLTTFNNKVRHVYAPRAPYCSKPAGRCQAWLGCQFGPSWFD